MSCSYSDVVSPEAHFSHFRYFLFPCKPLDGIWQSNMDYKSFYNANCTTWAQLFLEGREDESWVLLACQQPWDSPVDFFPDGISL